MKYLFLILLMIFHFFSNAQKSVFEVDTVSLLGLFYDINDSLRVFNDPITNTLDSTHVDRKIFVDNVGHVYWNTLQLASGNEGISLDLWNLGLHEPSETPSDVSYKMRNSKSFLPTFKTYLKDNKIIYETIESPRIILFTLSLDETDSLDELPFFLGGYYPRITLGNKNLRFTGDSTLNLNATAVPCYVFESRAFDYSNNMTSYSLNYIQILFERKSLLPLVVIERAGYRTYFNSSEKGYRTNYYTKVVSVN